MDTLIERPVLVPSITPPAPAVQTASTLPLEEMVASIDNQRQFELNMKLIKAAEEADRSGMSLLKISQ